MTKAAEEGVRSIQRLALKAVRLAGMTEREKSDVTAEVKVLSQLEHQNIVEYIESFQVQRIEYVCVSARGEVQLPSVTIR